MEDSGLTSCGLGEGLVEGFKQQGNEYGKLCVVKHNCVI